jgi:hypothetical protein
MRSLSALVGRRVNTSGVPRRGPVRVAGSRGCLDLPPHAPVGWWHLERAERDAELEVRGLDPARRHAAQQRLDVRGAVRVGPGEWSQRDIAGAREQRGVVLGVGIVGRGLRVEDRRQQQHCERTHRENA